MNTISATSTPKKPRAHYRIVYNQPPNAVKGVKYLKGNSRVNDLEAAINSITDDSLLETSQKSNVVVLSQEDTHKADKFVFLPKYNQKKVSLVRETPKKIITADGIARIVPKAKPRVSVVAKSPPSASSSAKKRKLGDMAMETWNTPKKAVAVPVPVPVQPEPEPEPVPERDLTNLPLCRICGMPIKETVSQLIDDFGALTQVGVKLKAITGTEINDSPMFPSTCCQGCKYKVQICFSLLIELQASDEVVRCTYADLQEGEVVNPSNHIYTCQDCEQEVVGMRAFIGHFEIHMQAKTIGPVPPEDDKSAIVKQAVDDGNNQLLEAQMFLEEDTDDGAVTYQNDLGEFVCEICGRTFKYLFLLHLHRKAPKRQPAPPPEPPKICFVCKEAKPSTALSADGETCRLCKSKEKDVDWVPDDEIPEQEEEEEEEETGNDDDEYKMEEEEEDEEIEKADEDIVDEFVQKKEIVGKKYSCEQCNSGFSYKYALKKHALSHRPDFAVYSSTSCHACLVEMYDLKKLQQHLEYEHAINYEPHPTLATCQICNKAFDDLFKLKLHLRLYHEIDLPVRGRSGSYKYTCHVCKQVFKSENAARIHMREEHNLSNNQMECLMQACEKCGKSFSVKQNLINHINSAHLKVKPLSCEVCGENFGKHSSLIFHRLRHTGEKPFQCSICSKSYRQRNDVVRHLARHVRDKEALYEEAYATNTSNSKYITKRNVYLRDSTMKGLVDLTLCSSTPRRTRQKVLRVSKPDPMDDDENTNEATEETYEEVVLQEGDYQVVEGEEAEAEGVQYVYTNEHGDYVVAGANGEYVIQEEGELVAAEQEQQELFVQSPSGTQYLVDGGDNIVGASTQYVIQENENGERFLVMQEEPLQTEDAVE